MMKPQKSKVVYYLVWLIIGGLLIYFGNSISSYYSEEAKKTFQIESTVWILAIVPLIYGLHLAFLEGLPKSFKLNWPLLVLVFLPCFLSLIYPILVMYINSLANVTIYKLATLPQASAVFGIVSGLTLIRSITTNRK